MTDVFRSDPSRIKAAEGVISELGVWTETTDEAEGEGVYWQALVPTESINNIGSTTAEFASRFSNAIGSRGLLTTDGPVPVITNDGLLLYLAKGYPPQMSIATAGATEATLDLMAKDTELISRGLDVKELTIVGYLHSIIAQWMKYKADAIKTVASDPLETMSQYSRGYKTDVIINPDVHPVDHSLDNVSQGLVNPFNISLYCLFLDRFLEKHGYRINHEQLAIAISITLNPTLFGVVQFPERKDVFSTHDVKCYDISGSFLLQESLDNITGTIQRRQQARVPAHCPAMSVAVWKKIMDITERIVKNTESTPKAQSYLATLANVSGSYVNFQVRTKLFQIGHLTFVEGKELSPLDADDERFQPLHEHPWLEPIS